MVIAIIMIIINDSDSDSDRARACIRGLELSQTPAGQAGQVRRVVEYYNHVLY